ncbi:cold shock domain-containing protein [Acidovorax sp. NCPPB 4044]|uniref:cold shock domain-containing protein n=1 Tax=Acidovorax sp. NCPPB 4044 TaxID=2940490 RepID=UPI002302942D|nr:cold shock domain-containing protein [Acidovorax sp. NCPPB 4044]MDA8521395.1 cold shock domain-containing protein [Acidovorax sp. NCPPB 4044]
MEHRFGGRLKHWNAERGFGFVVADDSGAELFVHISAFQRRDIVPSSGEPLTFEVEPDREGRRRAVRVLRKGEVAGGASVHPFHAPKHRTPEAARRLHGRDSGGAGGRSGRFYSAVVVLGVVGLIGWMGYSPYMQRAAMHGASLSAPAPAPAAGAFREPVPEGFRCDGRKQCSQMTSCREAKLFLQNCPGTQMDGNGDGVPCEQQWCVGLK